MKSKYIFDEPKPIQKAYLARYKAQLPALYADLKDFQDQLLEELNHYADTLKDSRNPALIKVYGQALLNEEVAASNRKISLIQNYIHETLQDINHWEFMIEELTKSTQDS